MTKIIVLAAGQGTRLRPHTNHLPKTLVPLNQKPLLEYQLEVYQQLNLSEVYLVAGYQATSFEEYGLPLFINPEYAASNMVYSLFCAETLFTDDEDVIVAYGDIIFEPDVLKGLLAAKGDIVVTADKQWESLWKLRMDDPLADAETFRFNENGALLELGKKPDSLDDIQAQYIGLVKFSGRAVKQLFPFYQALQASLTDEAFKHLYFTDYLQALIDGQWDVRCRFIERQWLEVDSVDDLNIYQELIKQKSFDRLGMSAEFFEAKS